MIQRQTWVYVTDNSLAQWVKVFHLYGGFKRRFTTINFYIKGSIRLVKPFIIYYKGFQVKKMQQGMIVRGLITRQVYTCLYKTSILYKTKLNTIVLIKKKNLFLSQYLFGPTTYKIRNKRLLLLFQYIL
uniref:Ribosomal protein L14 n=1 Tax=Euplotes aediculatus TaxID=5940 RepID=A0A8A9WR45_EUPAE|nr:ribosomal protein L14 [Euplotes aediculatus]